MRHLGSLTFLSPWSRRSAAPRATTPRRRGGLHGAPVVEHGDGHDGAGGQSGTGGHGAGGQGTGGQAPAPAGGHRRAGHGRASARAGQQGTGGGTSKCGNGVVDLGEQCDGANLAGRSCGTEGFSGGTLGCNPDCTLNTAQCGECNDGTVEASLGEDCDFDSMGKAIIPATCQSLGYATAGQAGLRDQLQVRPDPLPVRRRDDRGRRAVRRRRPGRPHLRDGGLHQGDARVRRGCKLVTTGCTKCGNGVAEAGEACDDEQPRGGDRCTATCRRS